MTWVKLDDGLPDNAKVSDLSASAFRTYITALCFCSRNLTDGQLTEAQLRKVVCRRSDVDELLSCGLFEAREGGGAILHDFLEYQPSRTQVEARRKAVTERVQKHRGHEQPSRNGNAVTQAFQGEPVIESVTPPISRPVPSDPVPSPESNPTQTAAPRPDRSELRETPGQPPLGLIPCPRDLTLTPDQRATLETCLVEPQAIDAFTRQFVIKAIADPNDKRTMIAWRKSLGMAISGNWNNPKKRTEAMAEPAPGVLEHERRLAAAERGPEREKPRRRPEPPLPKPDETLRMAEEALAKVGG